MPSGVGLHALVGRLAYYPSGNHSRVTAFFRGFRLCSIFRESNDLASAFSVPLYETA